MTTAEHEHYIEIVQRGTDDEPEKVVRRTGPYSARAAERMEAGLWINLNHEHYFTRIVAGETP